jgi:steroid 5-alpha reductase family enzyme
VSVVQLLLIVWISAAAVMLLGWGWQRRCSNAGIVDALWAALLATSALVCALLGPGAAAPRAVLGVCGGTWGMRLAVHLWRRVSSGPEDGRYRALREHWGDRQWPWFAFFQLQTALVPLFAVAFAVVAQNPVTRPAWLIAGTVIWALSVAGETLADAQLRRFKASTANRGRVCATGLWRYSRHPNYFCEWLHWFSYVAFAAGAPHAWLTLAGPVLMYVFLRYLSGIPFTEAQALRTRGESYRAYQMRTPMLFPWLPRRPPYRACGDPSP